VPEPGPVPSPRPVEVDGDALDRLERAALAIAGGEREGVVALQLGEPRSEILEAAKVYREAGRAALAVLLAQREPEKGRGS
jgi:hypothetical protein